MALEQEQRISEVVERERSRLRNFIRGRVPDPRDAEDVLQDVFYELVEANRLLMPIEHVTGWLFRVARNRITDLFRKKKPESFSDAAVADEDDELLGLEDLLPSPHAGPEAVYARNVLLDELELAVDELPEEQREVFVAHELEGRSSLLQGQRPLPLLRRQAGSDLLPAAPEQNPRRCRPRPMGLVLYRRCSGPTSCFIESSWESSHGSLRNRPRDDGGGGRRI
jgi:RNA polymerase sigma factor (sigma-70 family)